MNTLDKTSSIWKTNISELLNIFRDSLVTLVPCLDRARIKWTEDEAYDDWDAIAQSLYNSIVVNSIRYSLPEKEMRNLRLPEYDFLYKEYSSFSYVEILSKKEESSKDCKIFHSFKTISKPLDSVKCLAMNRNVKVTKDDFITYKFSDVKFVFQYRNKSNILIPVSEFSVCL